MTKKSPPPPVDAPPDPDSSHFSAKTEGVTIKLPLAYLRILSTEASRTGLKRGAFLTLLLRRKRKEVMLERATDVPDYVFTDEELRTVKPWIWYLSPQYRKLIDEDRTQMGLSTLVAWVTQVLNQWIGKPGGLRS